MVKYRLVRLCKEDAMSVVPLEMYRYDLESATKLLKEKGYEVVAQGPMVIIRDLDHEATFYPSGRILLSHVENKEVAASVANRIYDIVEGSMEPVPSRRS
jgi:hypothetical protein